MKINGIEGLTVQDLNRELQRGGKFVIYMYCVSIIVMTFKRSSDIYFIKAGEGGISKSAGWSALTFLLGWWGFPWGPIYSISSLYTNFSGGRNVTDEVMQSIHQQ